jgi:tRNA (guanine-N7-)-methyltransferase
MSKVRIRKHVNPLSKAYQIEAKLPSWAEVFQAPAQQLHLDIGCGKGRYILELAKQNPEWNFLGTEIRKPLVDRANRWAKEFNLQNIFYVTCNINVSIEALLKSLSLLQLKRVSIQFPDPWVKKKQIKRRIVTADLVKDLAAHILPETEVFIQSDVKVVAEDMREHFKNESLFKLIQDKLDLNPYGLETEWEKDAKKCKREIYRSLYSL